MELKPFFVKMTYNFMALNKKNNIFYNIERILAIIGAIAAIVTIYDYFGKTDIIFDNGKRPQLLTENKPFVTPIYEYKTPPFPRILVKDTNKLPSDTSLQNDIFSIVKNKSQEKYKLIDPVKLDIDSILSLEKNPYTIDMLPKFKFTIDLKNIGEKSADIILIGITDTNSYEPILRFDLLAKINDEPNETNNITKTISSHDKILPDSIYKFSEQYILQFTKNDDIGIIHFYFVYKDNRNKYYDNYLWVKYRLKKYTMDIIFEPLYAEKNKNTYELSKIITHYIPRKPKTEEVIEYIDKRQEYDYEFNKENSEQLDKIFGKH